MGMDLRGAESAACSDLRETHQRLHQSKLSPMIGLPAGDSLPIRQDCGLTESLELSAIDKGFQNVLLHIEVSINDASQLLAQPWQILNRLGNLVVLEDIVGGRLCANDAAIADILLDEALFVVAPDHRIGEVEILDNGLKLSVVTLGDFAPEDDGKFLGLSDGAVGVQQTLLEAINGGAPVENQIVAVLHLREEQAMLAAGRLAFLGGEERR